MSPGNIGPPKAPFKIKDLAEMAGDASMSGELATTLMSEYAKQYQAILVDLSRLSDPSASYEAFVFTELAYVRSVTDLLLAGIYTIAHALDEDREE